MKLIDMLVEDGMNGWQWPDRVECITQDNGSSIYKGVAFGYHKAPYLKKNIWLANNGTGHADAKIKKYDVVADDWDTAIITREQYEAALAAKNDGWIEWGGGNCPMEKGTLIDVKHRDGEIYQNKPAMGDNNTRWSHTGSRGDIIAYRLHKPQEAEQAEAGDEADLNECIGQDAAPVWNGEGLPPVGCECEIKFIHDTPPAEWFSFKLIGVHEEIVIITLDGENTWRHISTFSPDKVTFRPIRSEADKKRSKIIDALANFTLRGDAADIYDAIAAGKIPGLMLED